MSAENHHSNVETNSDANLPVADLNSTEVDRQSAEQVKGGSIVKLVDSATPKLHELAGSEGAGVSASGTGTVAK